MMCEDLTPNSAAIVPTAEAAASADDLTEKVSFSASVVSPLRDLSSELAGSSSCRKRRVSSCTLSDVSAASPPLTERTETTTLQQMIHQERECRSTPDHQVLLHTSCNEIQNHLWRERVSKWCYDVLDYLEESRDVAHVAMNFLDRYLAVLAAGKPLNLQPFEFEVTAFTALFLAVRVCGRNKDLQIPELLQLSSSGAEPRHIMQAGHDMLEKLSWDHRILTPHAFLKELLRLFFTMSRVTKDQAKSLFEFASYLVEVSVCDGYFSPCAPSHVALGALVVAMTSDATLTSDAAHQAFVSQFFGNVKEHIGISVVSNAMKAIIARLLEVYNQSHEAASSSSNNQPSEVSNGNSSSPHIILDDNRDHEMDLAISMKEGVMAMEEIRSVSPTSLECIHAMSSAIYQVAE